MVQKRCVKQAHSGDLYISVTQANVNTRECRPFSLFVVG